MAGQSCEHVRTTGERCRGFAVTGSRFCFAHDPAQAPKRDDARRRGGEAGKIEPLPDSTLSVRTTGDILALIETTINDVRAGRIDVRVANAIGYLANVSAKGIEQRDTDDRLEALESVLEPQRASTVASRRRFAS